VRDGTGHTNRGDGGNR